MNDRPCLRRVNAPREATSGATLFTNVTVVIDRSWNYQDIREILLYVYFRDYKMKGDAQRDFLRVKVKQSQSLKVPGG
jgi:hypothetical protein